MIEQVLLLDVLRELFKNITTYHSYSYFYWDTHQGPFPNSYFSSMKRINFIYFYIIKYIICQI